jgi:hypothetical protein
VIWLEKVSRFRSGTDAPSAAGFTGLLVQHARYAIKLKSPPRRRRVRAMFVRRRTRDFEHQPYR